MFFWNKRFNTDHHYEKWVKGGKKVPFYENEYSLIQKQINSNDANIQELGKQNMEKLAGYGYIPAVLWMGDYYKNNAINYELALKWYKLGSNQNQDSMCAYKCADLLVIMNGINNNYEAKSYYEIAVSNNIPEAAFALGELQLKDNNILLALSAYKKAAELGYEPAKDKIQSTEALISNNNLSFNDLIKKINNIGITKEQVNTTYYKHDGMLAYGNCIDGKCLNECNDNCPIKVIKQTEKNSSYKPKECIATIEMALLSDPFIHELWYNLGYWFERDSKLSDAYNSYLKSYELSEGIGALPALFRTSYNLKMYSKAGEWSSLFIRKIKHFRKPALPDEINKLTDKSKYSIKSCICSSCKSIAEVKVWNKIIIDKDSKLDEDLITGKLFHYKCSICGKINILDEPIYVKDFSRKYMFYYKKKNEPTKLPEGVRVQLSTSVFYEDPEVTYAEKQGLIVYEASSLREIQEKAAISSTNIINIYIMDIIKEKYRRRVDSDNCKHIDVFFNFSKDKHYGIEEYINGIPASFLPISKNVYLNIHDELINMVISNGIIPNKEYWESSFNQHFKTQLTTLEQRGLFNSVLEGKSYSIPQDFDLIRMDFSKISGSNSIVNADDEKIEAYDSLQVPKYDGIYEEIYSESKKLIEEGSIDSLKKALVALDAICDYNDCSEQLAHCKDEILNMVLENKI